MRTFAWRTGRLRQPAGAVCRAKALPSRFGHEKADLTAGSLNPDFATPTKATPAENLWDEDTSLSSLF
jgi:hypothetical protein